MSLIFQIELSCYIVFFSLEPMSTSRFNPTESNYWSSPRLKIPIKAVNLDLNHNVGGSVPAAYGKSASEPSSPQLWHKGTYI